MTPAFESAARATGLELAATALAAEADVRRYADVGARLSEKLQSLIGVAPEPVAPEARPTPEAFWDDLVRDFDVAEFGDGADFARAAMGFARQEFCKKMREMGR